MATRGSFGGGDAGGHDASADAAGLGDLDPAAEPAPGTAPAPDVFRVRLETTAGDILLEVRRAWSPHGADRFHYLVGAGFYDDAAVFRVRAGIWAQFGIPGDPRVAQVWRGRTIPDDLRVVSNTRGTLAYAFEGVDARSTQVFVNLRDNRATHDDEPFVPFAEIVEGIEVADAFYSGYGEDSGGGIRAGRQDPVFAGGNDHLRREFPLLDYIETARILD